MKFDFIVGNPPYQYPKGIKSDADKLYIDITEKCINLLKPNGTLEFITPKAILKLKNTKKLLENIKEVDYTIDKYFNIGQSVIRWKINKNKNKIKVIQSNNNIKYINNFHDISDHNEEILNSILNKVNYQITKRRKMDIIQASKQYPGVVPLNKCNIDYEPGFKEVLCSRQKYKNNIGYTKINNPSINRIVIPYGRPWSVYNQPIITDKYIDEMFFITKNNKNLNNKLSYIKSKLIIFCVFQYTNKIKIDGKNNFLFKLPELDFTRQWTDEELYNEFNLTKEEQEEVEQWYKTWK